MGGKAIIVDDDLIKKARSLACQGLTREQLARVLGMSRARFYVKIKEYPELLEQIEEGEAAGVHMVVNKLFQKATVDGDNTCMIFYLKNRAGWKDSKDVKHSGSVTHEHEGLPATLDFLAGFKQARATGDSPEPLPN